MKTAIRNTKLRGKRKTALCLLSLFFYILLMLCTAFSGVRGFGLRAYAETTETKFSKSYVMDDLKGMMIGGEQFAETSFSWDKLTGKTKVLTMVEYCYSYDEARQGNFNLYVYVFNPKGLTFVESERNTISLRAGTDEGAYNKYGLALLSKSKEKGYEGMFYKFGVELTDKQKAFILGKVESSARVYEISEIELTESAQKEAEAVGVSARYEYSGFAKGLGANENAGSTLTLKTSGIETVDLSVGHGNYRTMDFNGNNVCDELNTVYFSVPEKYFKDYGGLQKITAEWYEYKTNPIFVTSDKSAFNALKPYLGKDIGAEDSSLKWRVLWEEYSNGGSTHIPTTFGKAYNRDMGDSYINDFLGSDSYDWGDAEYLSRLDWIFLNENVKSRSDYKVSRETVKGFMSEYTDIFDDQAQLMGYAEGLFAESIDADRVQYLEDQTAKRGKIVRTLDADKDTQDLLFSNEKQSWWDKMWNGVDYEERNLSPIVVLTKQDMISSMTAKTFGEKYYIGETDREEAFNYCREAIANGERAVLFRFATTEYYASTARFDYDPNGMSDKDGYVAQMSMFLGFDIISLGFRYNDTETVIGVVANPIDIINGIDPPTDLTVEEGLPLWAWIVIAVVGLFLIGLLASIFKPIWTGIKFLFKVIWWVIKAVFYVLISPFLFIRWIVRKVRSDE